MSRDKRNVWRKNKQIHLNPTRRIAVIFGTIILFGALLLTLPIASRNHVSCGFRPALFTATSATCVTGLVLYDTWTQWSGFGQTVILALIEIGGLGFMSVAALVIFAFRKKIGLRQKMVITQALSLNDMASAVRIQRWALGGSISVQFLGALVLTLRFWPDYGFVQALKWGIFHAVSAFCNAGFDIFGSLGPGQSIAMWNNDPVVCITLMGLIITGGLGFFVWEELVRVRKFQKLSVYTRLVLLATAVLILAGALAVLLLEWNNPQTLGQMSTGQKILNGFFQSVTLRTAGFASFDQTQMTDAGKVVSILLMFVGGASGSTAGGVKTATVIVLLLFVWTRARGRSTVTVFRRTIPQEKVLDAMTIVIIAVLLALFGGIFICVTSPVSFTDGLFEAVSALATVGLSASVTTSLSIPAQFLIMLFMYFGRVGILTISLGFLMGDRAEERMQYAYTNLLIG